jgi:hypothetical protein
MANKYVESVIGPRIGNQPFSTAVRPGDPVYYDSGNSRWEQADSTDETKLAEFFCVGVNSMDAIPYGTIALGLVVTDSDAPFTAAAVQYLSETAGQTTQTRPTTAGSIGLGVGRAISTDKVMLQISPRLETSGYFGNGTAAAPSISFASDPDTGFWRSAANTLNVSVNGTEIMSLTGSAMNFVTAQSITTSAGALTLNPAGAHLMIDLAGSSPTPDPNSVHIWSGSAGSVDAPSGFPGLIVENDDHVGISLLSPANRQGRLMFGDPDDNDAAIIMYSHNDNVFEITVAAVNQLTWGNGSFAFQPATTISTAAGALTLNPTTEVIVSKAIAMGVVSDPSGVSNHAHIYVKDDPAEVYVRDEDGNVTKISPHNEQGEWEFYSYNSETGKSFRVNMEYMVRKLETITGEKFIQEEAE